MITENGWPSCSIAECDTNPIPGTDVGIPLQRGIPNIILKAFAADLNARIESVYNARGGTDEGGWTPTNSVATSNHLGGTAFDYNWTDHPMGPEASDPSAGWKGSSLIQGDQVPAIRDLLKFYTYKGVQLVFWGNDWSTPKDSMHFQMGYGTYANQDICREFIAKFIRADGFSTYNRGTTDGSWNAQVLAEATGLPIARAAAILPQVAEGLRLSECVSPRRIAMWLAQIGHESDNFNATEEYEKGDGGATERWKYLGRTWIQITWRENYAAFSWWAFQNGLIPTPTYFVDRPRELAELQYAGIGPAWYWTVARANINALCDRADLSGVTYLINGGYNGLPDRQNRYNRAFALGDRLLELIQEGDDMAQVPQDQWDRVFREQTQEHESLSGYRDPGEGNIGTWCRIDRNKDLMLHELYTEWKAVQVGDLDSIRRLVRSAAGLGANTSPEFIANAKRMLKKVPADYLQEGLAYLESTNPELLHAFISQNGASS